MRLSAGPHLVRRATLVSLLTTTIGAAGCSAPRSGDHPETARSAPVAKETAAATSNRWTPVVEAMPSPAPAGAAAPQLTVGAGRTILSWLEASQSTTTLKFAERTASGWTEPLIVASGRNFVTNAADVPSVRAMNGVLAAHWNRQYGDDPEAYSLWVSWSKDDGRSWSRPVTPHHDPTKTQHGFGTLFQAPGDGVGIVWLDGRGTNPEAPEGSNGSMALWGAVYGSDGRQRAESSIDAGGCDCCQTSAAETSDGVVVAYRDRTADEVRDIYVTRLADGAWSAPARVHNDGWKINGCPVNGPAVDARNRRVAITWFTAATSEGQAFVAFSEDAGRTFSQPIRVDDEAATGHVDVELLPDGSAAVSWTEL